MKYIRYGRDVMITDRRLCGASGMSDKIKSVYLDCFEKRLGYEAVFAL